MFLELFLKECKQTLKSLTYIIIIACMVVFYVSQMGDMELIEKPVQGQEDYGFTYSKDPQVMMQNAVSKMALEFCQNTYSTYPIGFYKRVTLDKKDQSKMEEIITEVTGLDAKELEKAVNDFLNSVTEFTMTVQIAVPVKEGMDFNQFLSLMEEADELLGGGSNYSETYIRTSSFMPMTYEQALEEYNEVVEKDHLSGAYARIFSDYLGIVLAILPVFLSVTRGIRDRRARAQEVIYSRKASSLSIITSRYLSMVVMLIVPVLLISLIPFSECLYYANSQGINIDHLAFVKYIFGWLLPTMLVSLSVGVVVTEFTNSALAILIQVGWWFISLFTGIAAMTGGYGWNLIPRHNAVGMYDAFHDNFTTLVMNRTGYFILAIVMLFASVVLYDLRRKGKLRVGKVVSNRKGKSED
ncbi:MAG: ABC transporter permease [Mobilitalea sp.]